MAETDGKPINGAVRQTLELGPTLAFFGIYMWIREDVFTIAGREYSGFIVATLVFIPILLAAMAVLIKLTGKVSRIQVFTAFMVIFFGGLTAWFNDERFFKMKTTIVYATFSALLGIGLMRGRSYLAWVLGGDARCKQHLSCGLGVFFFSRRPASHPPQKLPWRGCQDRIRSLE